MHKNRKKYQNGAINDYNYILKNLFSIFMLLFNFKRFLKEYALLLY